MHRKIGFILILTTLVLAALLQQKRMLFVPHAPPKVTSVVEYTKADGTIVHETAIQGRPLEVHWFLVAPLAAVFLAGLGLVVVIKPK